MALYRFGSFAVEWSLIYGARWGAFDLSQPFEEVLGLFIDLPFPGHKVGEPDAVVTETVTLSLSTGVATLVLERPIAAALLQTIPTAPKVQRAEPDSSASGDSK